MLEIFRRRLRSSENLNQWFERQKTRACVLHTPYTLVLEFVPPTGGVCGATTHAVGEDAGYSLLHTGFYIVYKETKKYNIKKNFKILGNFLPIRFIF